MLGIKKVVLPVSVSKIESVMNKLHLEQYSLVVMMGEANRTKITIEQYAYNEIKMRIPDNDGIKIEDKAISTGKARIETNRDVSQYLDEFVKLSTDPGRYLCNMVYYLGLTQNRNTVFIHVPISSDMDILRKVEALINAIEKDSNTR